MPQISTLLRCARPIFALPLLISVSGCKQGGVKQTPVVAKTPPPPPQIKEVDLRAFKPNEAGAVMVLMYHRFRKEEPDRDLNRQPDSFRKDLEDLYQRKYYPVTASEFVENKMDVPIGRTPIVLTFDDALPSQFKITSNAGQQFIDADSAVGILDKFHKAHPDWPLKGTFFVLPKMPFGQPELAADKFDYLVKQGFEVANHTSTHKSMKSMTADKVQVELANAVRDIKTINPQAQMRVFALPYGIPPHNADAVKALLTGSSGGTKYENLAVFRAAWRPVISPIVKPDKRTTDLGKLAIFDKTRLERITPDPRPGKGQTFEFWLKYFDENPGKRYVSDGDPKVVAFPKEIEKLVNMDAIRESGRTPQPYRLTSKPGGGSSTLTTQ